MSILAVFLVLLLFYSLVSRLLERTVITAPIIFTLGGLGLVFALPQLGKVNIERESFLMLAEIGLVMLLFTDASRISLKALKSNEMLPLRLLSVGMLLTILLGAVAARFVFPQLTLWEAGILAAILAPTDAGLGQVIVQSPRVPARIREALNVEAGLNDGLSVPFMMFFIAVARPDMEGGHQVLFRYMYEQLGLGALAGLLIGLAGGVLLGQARKRGWMDDALQQLGLVTLPMLCVLACKPTGGSMFIAAYVAGLAVQVGFKEAGSQSVEFAEGWGQLFDYFIFFFFGMAVALASGHFTLLHLLYALLSLTVIRMLPVAISLFGTGLSTATVLFMGWFGPRGLASIVLGVVFLEEQARLPGEETVRLAVMVTVMLSIVVHGFSALPGIDRYARTVASLDATAPENRS